ncbi:hypothetical protein Y032_0154g3022 [Ancylostoma ceylanicum]|uniref:Uncharacterized protein n=1 Tax=Ancylostoma ceylanicum TaxID=53326 RepID=A0A016T0D1_9BILA|nr:hypothetical protein Y032_0154g3022 [Ancylostoma ceylanicum]
MVISVWLVALTTAVLKSECYSNKFCGISLISALQQYAYESVNGADGFEDLRAHYGAGTLRAGVAIIRCRDCRSQHYRGSAKDRFLRAARSRCYLRSANTSALPTLTLIHAMT